MFRFKTKQDLLNIIKEKDVEIDDLKSKLHVQEFKFQNSFHIERFKIGSMINSDLVVIDHIIKPQSLIRKEFSEKSTSFTSKTLKILFLSWFSYRIRIKDYDRPLELIFECMDLKNSQKINLSLIEIIDLEKLTTN